MEEKKRLEEDARLREEEERKRIEEEERQAEEEERKREEEKQRRKDKEKAGVRSGRLWAVFLNILSRPSESSQRKKVVFSQRNKKRSDRWQSSENKLFWLPGFRSKAYSSLRVAVRQRKSCTVTGRRNMSDKKMFPLHRNRDHGHRSPHLRSSLNLHKMRKRKTPNLIGRQVRMTREKLPRFRPMSIIPGMLRAMKKSPVHQNSKTLGMPRVTKKKNPRQSRLRQMVILLNKVRLYQSLAKSG